MNTSSALSIDSISDQRKASFVLAGSLTLSERRELHALLTSSYPDMRIDEIFEDYPCTKQLYVFRLWIDDVLVASRQILIVDSIDNAPAWSVKMADILSIKRFAIGSRAIVHADFRNQGLGSELIQRVNNETYKRHKLDTILGSSTSLTAISLYLRLGARLWRHANNRPHLHDTVMHYEMTYGKNFNHRSKHYARMQYPLHYLYHRPAMNGDWEKYLWTPNPQHNSRQLPTTQDACQTLAYNP